MGEEEFDIGEDLEKSLDMFQGMIKAKDDEIEVLNIKVLELKKELEFQEDKDKDFEVLQKIAEDEVNKRLFYFLSYDGNHELYLQKIFF